MSGILIAKVQGLIRKPGLFLSTTVMSIVFAFIFGGMTINKVDVPIFIEGQPATLALLAENQVFAFSEVKSLDALEQKVSHLKAEFGVVLYEDRFEMMVGVDSPNVMIVEQVLEAAYVEAEQRRKLADVGVDLAETIPSVFTIESVLFHSEDSVIFDDALYRLFGFTMFFVMYTIAYSVLQILIEKRDGIWDRMILSSVRKWEMYAGNFIYSFFLGYVQILIVFFIFRFVLDVDFHGAFGATLLLLIPYVLAIVSLFIFVTSIVKSVQQFNAITPIIPVSMAMIGGAYWPLEIVDSNIMLLLSKVNPITYGLEALEGVAVYGMSLREVLFPVSVLLMMSVLMTGIGMHLMERRYLN